MITPVEKLTYRQAMKELQEIVDRLRDTETEEGIDVDELVADVTRAKVLLDYCGSKVKQADTQIRNVIKELKPESKAELSEGTSPAEPESFAPTTDEVPF
jgi:exodeoxyribonuclease VII small subunit